MRILRAILISVLICLTLFSTVSAINVDTYVCTDGTKSEDVQPRAEETKWYYKTVDGVVYVRLWSITYGKWLTDWMPA